MKNGVKQNQTARRKSLAIILPTGLLPPKTEVKELCSPVGNFILRGNNGQTIN
jgi:hypothetical protein